MEGRGALLSPAALDQPLRSVVVERLGEEQESQYDITSPKCHPYHFPLEQGIKQAWVHVAELWTVRVDGKSGRVLLP